MTSNQIEQSGRAAQVRATRELILTAAEQLFGEHGVYAVSNRHVSEAAGQGNNAAVGYHFGTKADLIRAIIRRHAEPIEQLRITMVREVGDSPGVREWVECLIRPSTEHLGQLVGPTWYARFSAQVMTDPALRQIMIDEALDSPALHQILANLTHCLPDLPADVRRDRSDMARHLMVHIPAERERALACDDPTPRRNWHDTGTGLIDAITAVWLAPYQA